jgi:5-methylcytosine-specific restriction endonuclease McrA
VRTYSLRHLADSTLRHALKQLVHSDLGTTALIVAHIAEFIARKLYLEDGYASMYDYCLGELKMSEDVACRRIRAARAARRFPQIFDALADGRIHLTGISLLAPHLTEENAEGLLAASVHKTKREIQLVLAARFPQPDLPTFIASLGTAGAAPATLPSPQGVLGQTPAMPDTEVKVCTSPVHSSAPARIADPVIRAVTPLAPGRFGWQLTVDQETQDLLGDVEDLLGRDVPPGDLAAVLKFALRTAKEKLLQRKYAQTERPRAGHPSSNPDSRHIPADVRRAVRKRDGGRCTFTSDTGHRCEERKDLEFDHIEPYARGGEASVGGIRLLCRAHNQYEAERAFGVEFMRHKRLAAAEARAGRIMEGTNTHHSASRGAG